MEPLVINQFLGLNMSLAGDTNLKIGEFANMKNIRITSDYKARKREGYSQIKEFFGGGTINGMCIYKDKLIVAHDNDIYEISLRSDNNG